MLYYSTELFIGAGLASESAKYATIGKAWKESIFVAQVIWFHVVCRCGCHHGGHDSCVHSSDGSRWPSHPSFMGTWRHVYFQHIHHHFLARNGKSPKRNLFSLWLSFSTTGMVELNLNLIRFDVGTNRMGSLRSRCCHTHICIVFRRWTRLHSMDDYSRAIQSRTKTSRHVYRRTCQLVGKFSCRSLLLTSQSKCV